MSEAGAPGSDASDGSATPAGDAAMDAAADHDAHGDSGPADAGGEEPSPCIPVVVDDAVLEARTLPELTVDDVLVDTEGIVYVYSSSAGELHRWSTSTESSLGIVDVGANSTHVVYSAVNDRIYVAYADGAVRQIDAATLEMTDFVVVPARPRGLVAGGPFVMVADASAGGTHRSFAADGSPISAVDGHYESLEYAYSEGLGMVYALREGTHPRALLRDPFDPVTGVIPKNVFPGPGGETFYPFEPDYPIIASADGDHVIVGTGDVFAGADLAYQGSLPRTIRAGLWLPGGDLVTLAEEDGATLLERWNELWHRKTVERLQGKPLHLLRHESQVWALVDVGGRPRFVPSSLSDDGDCDGIGYEDDRFPIDPAASQDSDFDGFPDAWNPGRTASDSTTGLTLDAFPADSACHLPAHGVGGSASAGCDILRSLDWNSFVPAFGVLDQRGIVYLFRTDSAQVARWDSATGTALNPLILSGPPASATYSKARDRLYVGLQSGAIVQFAPATSLRPLSFAFAHQPVRAVLDAEDFVIVTCEQTGVAIGSVLSFASSGALAGGYTNVSTLYGPAYSPARDRLYFVSGQGRYTDVDAATGRFGATTSAFITGDPTLFLASPIQFSSNGAEVFYGNGYVIDADLRTKLRSFPTATKYLVTPPNRLMTMSSGLPDSVIRRFFGGVEGGSDRVPGKAELLFDAGAKVLVVSIVPSIPSTIGRDPPSFYFLDPWKDP